VIDVDDEVMGPKYDQTEDGQQLYNLVVSKGFTYRTTMHHESQLITSIHHVRIPVHFMGGILIHETEDDKRKLPTNECWANRRKRTLKIDMFMETD
jgi:uncharacterized lipoprotein YmbA